MENKKATHISELDGLRGVAILLVLTFHYFGFLRIFSFGWSGVDLFFVLSGFLITEKLMISARKPGYLKNFFANRILRIVPLYYAVLLLFYTAFIFRVHDEHLQNISFYKEHWKSFFIFTENWAFFIHGIPKDQYFVHFWSIAIEMQFYLIWPFIILGLSRSKMLTAALIILFCAALISRCVYYYFFWHGTNAPMFNLIPFFKIDSFSAGAIVYCAYCNKIKIRNIAVNCILLISIFVLSIIIYVYKSCSLNVNILLGVIGYSFIACFYASILFSSLQPAKKLLNTILNSKLLMFTGKISYGLYIIHWPVLLLLKQPVFNFVQKHFSASTQALNFISLTICMALSFLLSIISFYYFETYFLKLKKKNT